MAKQKTNTGVLPSVVSLLKKVNVSDAKIEGVEVYAKTSRNAVSHQDENKKNEGTNINRSEMCDAKGDKVTFTFNMQVMPFQDFIAQTNDVDFYEKMKKELDKNNFKDAIAKNAEYLAYNVISGAWLWRNRSIAERIVISVRKTKGGVSETVIEGYEVNIPGQIVIDKNNGNRVVINDAEGKKALDKLAASFIDDLMGDELTGHYTVTAEIDSYKGQKFYPSQLFTETNKGKNDLSRQFYKDIDGDPAISAEKVWNALRTYDVWYDNFAKVGEPISIEPLGSNLKLQATLRGKNNNFYVFMEKIATQQPLTDEEKIYSAACLLRGGAMASAKEK